MSAGALNRRIVLARRPQGAPVAEDFRLEELPVPVPAPGQVLLRTRFLSLDPYMRGRMNEGPSYAPPVALGAVMTGQTVSVVETAAPGFEVGDLVVANVGWQDYGVSNGRDLVKIDPALPLDKAALVGCGVLTGVGAALRSSGLEAGQTVAVFGCGGVGLAIIQGARIGGIQELQTVRHGLEHGAAGRGVRV